MMFKVMIENRFQMRVIIFLVEINDAAGHLYSMFSKCPLPGFKHDYKQVQTFGLRTSYYENKNVNA